jgi:putative DNA-invertase from lambdoid prophage Rac
MSSDSLKDRGVNLQMMDLGGDVTDNGISKLVFMILSAVAEADRDRIREVKADLGYPRDTSRRMFLSKPIKGADNRAGGPGSWLPD